MPRATKDEEQLYRCSALLPCSYERMSSQTRSVSAATRGTAAEVAAHTHAGGLRPIPGAAVARRSLPERRSLAGASIKRSTIKNNDQKHFICFQKMGKIQMER